MEDSKLVQGGLMTSAVVAQIGYNGLMRGQRVIIPGLRNRIQMAGILRRGICGRAATSHPDFRLFFRRLWKGSRLLCPSRGGDQIVRGGGWLRSTEAES